MAPPFQPFDPDGRRFARFTRIPMRLLLPNLVTLLALCLGLTAVRMAVEGRFELALAGIVIAALLDGVDGRLARALKGTSRFGAELDSLADFVNFGCAPALILYMWGLDAAGSIGWIAALLFAICAALRLARFNVMLDDPNRPAFAADFFTGVPAPAGAITVLLPVYLDLLGLPHGMAADVFALLFTLAIGALMISKVPAWSGKTLGKKVRRDMVLPLFVLVALFAGLLASYPWAVLAVGSVLYLAFLPFSAMRYHTLMRAHEAEQAAKAPAADETPSPR